MNCEKCGSVIPDGQKFCQGCGAPAPQSESQPVKKSAFAKQLQKNTQDSSEAPSDQPVQMTQPQPESAPVIQQGQTTPAQPTGTPFAQPQSQPVFKQPAGNPPAQQGHIYQQAASARFAQAYKPGNQQPVSSPYAPPVFQQSPFVPSPDQAAAQQPANQQMPYQQQMYPPLYQQPEYLQPVYQQPKTVAIKPEEYTSAKKKGTPGLVLGIVALAIFWIPFLNVLASIPAAIISIIGLAKKDSNKVKSVIAVVLSCLAFLISICYNSVRAEKKRNTRTTETQASVVQSEETTVTSETTAATDPIVGDKTSFKDLGVGEIGKKDGVYVGLQYVKQADELPTRIESAEPESGNTVILAFFEFYNGSEKTKKVRPSDITCYVDGTQVGDVDTIYKVFADGVHQYYVETLDPGCQLVSVQDFEVPEEWQEIKFYYQSECVWTISNDDVHEEDYEPVSLFSVDNSKTLTKEDELIYSDKYDIRYEGAEIYYDDNYYIGDLYYVVFKFHITNSGENTLDTSLFGYNMRCYQDNFYLGDAEYILDDTINGYIDIHNIDSIEPDMSADVYVAFETSNNVQTGDFYMIYDDGYGTNHYCGYVYDRLEEVEEEEE